MHPVKWLKQFLNDHAASGTISTALVVLFFYGSGIMELARGGLLGGLILLALSCTAGCLYFMLIQQPWLLLKFPLFEICLSVVVAGTVVLTACLGATLFGLLSLLVASSLVTAWLCYQWSDGASPPTTWTMASAWWLGEGTKDNGIRGFIAVHPKTWRIVSVALAVTQILLGALLLITGRWPWLIAMVILSAPIWCIWWTQRSAPKLPGFDRGRIACWLCNTTGAAIPLYVLAAVGAFWLPVCYTIAVAVLVLLLAVQIALEIAGFDDPTYKGQYQLSGSYVFWAIGGALLLIVRLVYMWLAKAPVQALLLPGVTAFPVFLLILYCCGMHTGRNVTLIVRSWRSIWRIFPLLAIVVVGYFYVQWILIPTAKGALPAYSQVSNSNTTSETQSSNTRDTTVTSKSTSTPPTPTSTPAKKHISFNSTAVCGQKSCTAQQAQAFVDGILARISKDRRQGNEARGYTGSPEQESARLGILLFVSGVSHPDMEQLVRFAPDSNPQTATVGYEGAAALDSWLRGQGKTPQNSSFTIASFAIKGMWNSSLWVYDPGTKKITVVQ